ncbi:hypothetical protein, partial [Acinetobacter johnsonii]
CHKILHILMFITSFGEQNITYKCCSNFLIHLSIRGALHFKSLCNKAEKICKKLNIELTPHGLRRSYKTLAIWAKINEGSLAQISGHKPSALVERHYIVRPMDMLQETLQEYEDWILQQVRNGIN